jgi:hypothetical protein
MRRASGKRVKAVTFDVFAKRAREAILLDGICVAVGSVIPKSRMFCKRSIAFTNAGPLIITGLERKRSSQEARLLSTGIVSKRSNRAHCSVVMPCPSRRHKRA